MDHRPNRRVAALGDAGAECRGHRLCQFAGYGASITGAGGPGSILVAPAERADVVVDFSAFTAGQTISLTDVGLPAGVVSPTKPLGAIMQFRVTGTKPASDFGDPDLAGWGSGGGSGRPQEGDVTSTSLVTLDEIVAKNGKPLLAVMNNSSYKCMPDGMITPRVISNGRINPSRDRL